MNVLRANLRSSGKRLWAAGAAITISVAFIVSGMLLVNSFTQAVEEDAEADLAGTDVVVSTEVLGGIPTDGESAEVETETSGESLPDQPLADRIQQMDSVELAEPLRMAHLQENDDESGHSLMLSAEQIGQTRDAELVEGRAPDGADEVLVNEAAAESGTEIGDILIAEEEQLPDEGEGAAASGPADGETPPEDASGASRELAEQEYTVVGVVDATGFPSAFMTQAAMEQLPSAPSPSEIRVVLAGEAHGEVASQEQAQHEIVQLIGSMIEAGDLTAPGSTEEPDGELTPEALEPETLDYGQLVVAGMEVFTSGQQVDQSIAENTGDADLLSYIAYGFGGIAVFVSALVITNTFQVLVASRQRTLALLRAVGATAAQLRRATIGEGALLGLAGGALGVLLGWGLAAVLRVILHAFTSTELPAAMVTVPAVVVGLTVAVAMAMLAALHPALKAGRVSPMAALRPADVPGAARSRIPWLRLICGGLLVGAGLAAVLFAALYSPPASDTAQSHVDPLLGVPLPLLGGLGAVLGFLGVLLWARMIIPPLVSALGRLLGLLPGLGVTATLAGKNARQVPGRTAATSSALLVGVTLVGTMTVGAATAERMLYTELAESYPVDGVVSGDLEARAELTEQDLVTDSAELPGVRATLETESGSEEVSVLVMEPGELDEIAHTAGMEPEPGQILYSGSMMMSDSAVIPGDEVELIPSGASGSESAETSLTGRADLVPWLPHATVAVNAEDVAGGEDASATEEEHHPWSPSEDRGITVLRTAEGLSEAQVFSLQSSITETGSEAESGEEAESDLTGAAMRAVYTQMIDVVLGVVLLLLAAAVVVAVIGVSNTLSLSVFERRREAALLRAVGMSRRSVGRMITLEAVLISMAALVLGSGLGMFFGWAGVSSLTARDDWSVVLDVPWVRMGVIWAVTLVAAVLAAWLPARELSRVQPAQGLSRD